MSFSIKMLRPAKRELDKLDKNSLEKINNLLEELKVDPFRPRPKMNIDKIEGNKKPPAYRLKFGRLRIEYIIHERQIIIFNIFVKKRKSDYR